MVSLTVGSEPHLQLRRRVLHRADGELVQFTQGVPILRLLNEFWDAADLQHVSPDVGLCYLAAIVPAPTIQDFQEGKFWVACGVTSYGEPVPNKAAFAPRAGSQAVEELTLPDVLQLSVKAVAEMSVDMCLRILRAFDVAAGTTRHGTSLLMLQQVVERVVASGQRFNDNGVNNFLEVRQHSESGQKEGDKVSHRYEEAGGRTATCWVQVLNGVPLGMHTWRQ